MPSPCRYSNGNLITICRWTFDINVAALDLKPMQGEGLSAEPSVTENRAWLFWWRTDSQKLLHQQAMQAVTLMRVVILTAYIVIVIDCCARIETRPGRSTLLRPLALIQLILKHTRVAAHSCPTAFQSHKSNLA